MSLPSQPQCKGPAWWAGGGRTGGSLRGRSALPQRLFAGFVALPAVLAAKGGMRTRASSAASMPYPNEANAPKAPRNAFIPCGGSMRTNRNPESEEQQNERLAKEAQRRSAKAAAEDKAIDDMVKRSIKQYGP